MDSAYEVTLDGGGPWGIRLQGGKDFGLPLNIARVTPGSKAANKRVVAGDIILSINGAETESMTHMDAQNAFKAAGDRLHLMLRSGTGVSVGVASDIGAGGFAATPKTMHTTETVHSAGVDYKFNSKPRAFPGGETGSRSASGSTSPQRVEAATATKFDPAEYARKKKEELDRYKQEKNKPPVPDSDVLKMLQQTKIDDKQGAGSFSKLETQLQNEDQWKNQEQSFRMVASGTDLSEVSPQSRVVIEDIKNRGKSGLGANVGTPSRSFKYLQQMTAAEDEDLPPPPPELIGSIDTTRQATSFGNVGPGAQSRTFQMLQDQVDKGGGDQVQTVFNQPKGSRGTAVPMPQSHQPRPVQQTATTVNPIPKAPMPNFKVGRPSAPTFKPNPVSSQPDPGPPPPPVNSSQRQDEPRLVGPSGQPSSPPADRGGSINRVMTRGAPHAVPTPSGSSKDLYCHACQQPLTGPFVSAIGKTWHPEHFCCSSCSMSLQNQAFVEENGQLFCEKCYNQYYAPKCANCNNAIIGNCINALGKSWHPDHFVCAFCSRQFGSDGFLVDSGKPYCEKCFEDLFSVKCGKCNRPITGGEKYVEALSKNWHSDCFACTVCNARLEGNSFFVSRGMPYCQNHKGGR